MTYDELNLEELFLKHNFLSAGLHNLFSSSERRLRDEGLRETDCQRFPFLHR